MEAFLAAQVLYGGENSDSDSFKSDLSETYGASSYQRRPGSGRRKKQAPWRSPWDASVSTDYAPQYLPPDYEPSRLGLAAIIDPSPSSRPITPVIEVGAAAVSNPNPAFKSKKAKQDLSGPCCHCNATSSPQWRKGPKGKPVLCNACGIRFLRTRTLGKAMPKKRRTTAAAAGGEHTALTQPKRIKADEASTEEEEFNTEEVLAADDANMAVDESLEEANSGSLNHSSIGFPDLAAAVVMGHHAGHAYHQSAAALLPISRLALASSAAGALHDETGYAETQECRQYGQSSEQQYAQQQYASRAPVDLNAATAAALVPQLSWLTTSINPLGPNAAAGSGSGRGSSLSQQALQTAAMRLAAAAAMRRVGTTSSSSSDVRGHNALSSSSSPGLTEPLAAGSRLLLSAGAGSKANNNPSLTAVLAMHHHQQQLQRECSSDQQQPQSPLALGIYSSSALAGSPISHQSALQPYLKAEFSGLSYGTGSAPASPLALPAAASSGMYHMTLSSNSSGGIYSACTSTRQQQQQLQHGLHRPSPLSVMAATAAAVDASVAAHQDALSVADGREGLGAAAPEQLGDLAAARCPQVSGQVDDIMYNTAAAAVPDSTPTAAGTGEASTPDMTQLIRLVANALGGMGNTWEVLKSLNNNTVTPAAAAVTAAGGAHLESVISKAVLQQQHQYP